MSPSGGARDKSGEKKGLECPERAENVINRKIELFYQEFTPNVFFQLRKIEFKKRFRFFKFLSWQIFENVNTKIQNSDFQNIDFFDRTFFDFQNQNFRFFCWKYHLFSRKKSEKTEKMNSKNIFRSWKKNVGYKFLVKKFNLSILWGFQRALGTLTSPTRSAPFPPDLSRAPPLGDML